MSSCLFLPRGQPLAACQDKQDDEHHVSSRSINNTHPTQSPLLTYLGYLICNLRSSEVTARVTLHSALVNVVYLSTLPICVLHAVDGTHDIWCSDTEETELVGKKPVQP